MDQVKEEEEKIVTNEERLPVKIRKSRSEIGSNITTSFVVPAGIKMAGRSVTREIDPEGDSVMEFNTKEEAEAAVIKAGYRPIY